MFYHNLKEVFSKTSHISISLVCFSIMFFVFYSTTDTLAILGNLGKVYIVATWISQILVALLFSVFISVFVYRWKYFSSFSIKDISGSATGGTLGILASGCPACSVTLASYFGLVGALSYLPFFGLEIKILGILIISYALYSSIKNLKSCPIKTKKHNGKEKKTLS